MKFLGIDFGEKRIGLAISDEEGKMAFPLSVVSNDRRATARIAEICKERTVSAVIMGESKNFQGLDNPVMDAVRQFGQTLQTETGLPVEFEPEFMTSAEADRMKPPASGQNRKSGVRLRRPKVNNKMLDASAATLILKSYLDKNIKR